MVHGFVRPKLTIIIDNKSRYDRVIVQYTISR